MEAFELLTYKGAKQLFQTLHTYPKRQFTINELSKTAGVPFTTTWKLIQKFEKAQIVDVWTIGKSRAVRYKESPFSGIIVRLIRISASTQSLAVPELKRILKAKEGVMRAYLFGSVAIGKEKLESDIDVAILTKRRIDLPSFISSIQEKYGVTVVPLEFRSREELKDFLLGKKVVKLV